jgi:type IV pilus assembly protein PilV
MPATRSLPSRPAPRRLQHGVMLLEALIAILIFSIGILGVVGLQATAVKQSTDARYRAEAAQLAEQLMGLMWVSDRTATNLQTQFNTCTTGACPGFQTWFQNVKATLPGVDDNTNVPQVNVRTDGTVNITLFWLAPNEEQSSDPHRFDIETQIGQ